MKVISILQPWASLVVLGHKKIETRSWNTKYRGPLLIHASAGKKGLNLIDKIDPFGELATELLKLDMQYYNYPLGAIIGQVNLMDTFPFDAVRGMIDQNMSCYIGGKAVNFSKQELAFGEYSPNRYGWLLSNPVEFPAIIPVKGKLGIWDFDMPEKIGFNLVTGGHASFEGMPDKKTVEALEEMAQLVKKSKLFK